jgi:hypothetical protein
LTDPDVRRIDDAGPVVEPMCGARSGARITDDSSLDSKEPSMIIVVAIALALIAAMLVASRFVTVDEVFLQSPHEPTIDQS